MVAIGAYLTNNASWYMDILREMQWAWIKGILWLLDGFFDLINSIWKYSFFDNAYVNKLYSGALILAGSWLILKIMIELITNHIVKSDDNYNPLSIYKGAILAIVMMFLISPLFTFGNDFSTKLNNAVLSVSHYKNSTKTENKISSALIMSMTDTSKLSEEDKKAFTDDWKNIDINKKEGGFIGFGGTYIYKINFVILLILVIVIVILLFFVGIQMAKRIIELALYKIIGPFCCTSLTNKNSNSFNTWFKNLMGLFLITTVQLLSLCLMIEMISSSMVGNRVFISIFLIIGALLFVINTPAIISSLLSQQSGVLSAFGDLQSMLAIGQGITTSIVLAKSGFSTMSKVVGCGGKTASASGGSGISQNMNKSNFSQPNPNRKMQEMSKNGNNNQKSNNDIFKMTNSNPFLKPYGLNYNVMRNQYINSQDGLSNINNIDRTWY